MGKYLCLCLEDLKGFIFGQHYIFLYLTETWRQYISAKCRIILTGTNERLCWCQRMLNRSSSKIESDYSTQTPALHFVLFSWKPRRHNLGLPFHFPEAQCRVIF